MTVATIKENLATKGNPAAPKEGEIQLAAFPKMLAMYQDEVSKALPAHLRKNADRYTRIALTEFRMNPKLAECDPRSIFAAVILSSQMGWEISGPLGHAYLVPYGGEAQLIPGWKGYVDLVHRSGRAQVWTGAVYQGDKFAYQLGSKPYVEHESNGEDDITKLSHVYAIGWIKDMAYPIVEVWPLLKLQRHRDRYNKVGQKHYSFQHFEMYARKVVLLQNVKYLPASVQLASALNLDYSYDEGRPQRLEINAAAEGVVFPTGLPPTTTTAPTEPAKEEVKTEETKAEPTKPVEEKSKEAPKVEKKVEETKKEPTKPAETKKAEPATAAPPAWATEKKEEAPKETVAPAQEVKPDPPAKTAAPAAKGKEIKGVVFPANVRRTDESDAYTPEQLEKAKAALAAINPVAGLDKTVEDWFGVPLGELSAETMVGVLQVLENWKKPAK